MHGLRLLCFPCKAIPNSQADGISPLFAGPPSKLSLSVFVRRIGLGVGETNLRDPDWQEDQVCGHRGHQNFRSLLRRQAFNKRGLILYDKAAEAELGHRYRPA